jgi:hypothetical protein
VGLKLFGYSADSDYPVMVASGKGLRFCGGSKLFIIEQAHNC